MAALANVAMGEESGWFEEAKVQDYVATIWVVVNRADVGHAGCSGYADCASRPSQFAYDPGRNPYEDMDAIDAAKRVLIGMEPDPTGGALFFRDDTTWESDQEVTDALIALGAFTGWVEHDRSEPWYDDRPGVGYYRTRIGHYFFTGSVPHVPEWWWDFEPPRNIPKE